MNGVRCTAHAYRFTWRISLEGEACTEVSQADRDDLLKEPVIVG